ncbi:MAG: hypothetical protein RR413_12535 [Christensenellaceae bacterium]
MAIKKFTEEEMNLLKESEYVLAVSPSIVHFSADFKKKFWEALLERYKPREIIVQLGLDPEILGEKRINGLKAMIHNDVKAGKGFSDLNTYNQYLKSNCIFATPEGKIKYLEQQLAYKDQELEFLKKIVSLKHVEAK